eukprot:scaffold86408_cov45-Phaeocystis_antarctica.AAC.1
MGNKHGTTIPVRSDRSMDQHQQAREPAITVMRCRRLCGAGGAREPNEGTGKMESTRLQGCRSDLLQLQKRAGRG